ncbi:MAG: hypothetical protein ACKOQ7_00305, partial [Actinomycetota bacterium]
VSVFSAGSAPGAGLNPVAVEVMGEVGIDIAGSSPQRWTEEFLHAVDVVVTMGCDDECPYIPGKRYIDWPLEDPAGKGIEVVRRVRDEIKVLVEGLVSDLSDG